MEGHCHDPVSEVEGFLDPITMVDVNINVEHPRVVPGMRAKPGSEAEVDPKKKLLQPFFLNTRSEIIKSLLLPHFTKVI